VDEPVTGFAQVECVPPEFSGKILGNKLWLWLRRINTFSPLFFIGGVGLILWGAHFFAKNAEEGGVGRPAAAVVFGVIGWSVMVIAILLDQRNVWLRRIALAEFRKRPGKIVDPDAGGALFVEIVPESNWLLKGLPENATDVGFLRIDTEGRQLLFEGEFMRYRIPAGAVVNCKQDYYTRLVHVNRSESNVYFHFVVVTARFSAESTVEIPFRIRRNVSVLSDEKARMANYRLYQQISALAGTGAAVAG
jgi:hypothetical protein